MGFLQNDSNNIIVDAVLTDLGRNFLARNDGSFSVIKFAASDDEVDYSLIKKFGRTLGMEKIEKNTGVFEALTNQTLAQKYRAISVSNPNLVRMPTMVLTGDGVTTSGTVVNMGIVTARQRTLQIEQTLLEGTSVDIELRDQSFIVQMDNRFLEVVSSAGADNIDRDQKATYILTRADGQTTVGGSRLSLRVGTKAITESQFQIYGARSNKNLINTYVRVSGTQSGQVLEFQVVINKTG